MADESGKIYAYVDYEDPYVQPLLLGALKVRLPPEVLVFINDILELPPDTVPLLQWRQYESIDFHHLIQHSTKSVANSYVIRKALIRKHYLSATVAHWLTKNPTSVLRKHVKPSVEFEVDYAEFLDDALLEAFELKESWGRNEGKDPAMREWWILKPGMSDRGQGIRLFSSEEELTAIFEDWDPCSDVDDDEATYSEDESSGRLEPAETSNAATNGVITSHLRHFVAQPYIDPPLLLAKPHTSAGRKFHLRTYVLAVGALQVYVYKSMLALFAAEPYDVPCSTRHPNDTLSSHLTNTCLQTGEREGSVHAFWSLPPSIATLQRKTDWRQDVFDQICRVTGEVFEAAARTMSVHFQPLPNAFEVFGVDFLVDADGTAWMLEINAFPDFAQTGDELKMLIGGLFEEIVDIAVKPFFSLAKADQGESRLVKVLDVDLGRR